MSGTRAELATQALLAHSPVVLVTRVEENSNPANIGCVPFNSFCVKCLSALCGNTIEMHLTFFMCLKYTNKKNTKFSNYNSACKIFQL